MQQQQQPDPLITRASTPDKRDCGGWHRAAAKHQTELGAWTTKEAPSIDMAVNGTHARHIVPALLGKKKTANERNARALLSPPLPRLHLHIPGNFHHACAQRTTTSREQVDLLLVGAEAGLQAAVLLDEDHVLSSQAKKAGGRGAMGFVNALLP